MGLSKEKKKNEILISPTCGTGSLHPAGGCNDRTGWTDDLEDTTALVAGADGAFSVTNLSAGEYGLLQTHGIEGYNLLRESPIHLEEGQTNQVTVRIPPELELPDLFPSHRIWALALLGVGLLILISAFVARARNARR